MSTTTQVSKEKLTADFKTVVDDAEELLRATADQAGEKTKELRDRIKQRLQSARSKLAEVETVVAEKTKAAAHATDHYVHENPWRAVGIATGVGLIIGLLIGRR